VTRCRKVLNLAGATTAAFRNVFATPALELNSQVVNIDGQTFCLLSGWQ
jgi:hypothetical protein